MGPILPICCKSATPTLPVGRVGEGTIMCTITSTAQPWKAGAWGERWAMWRWDLGRSVWILLITSRKDTMRATLCDEPSQLSFLVMAWMPGKQGKKSINSFLSKEETLCCVCSVSCFYPPDSSDIWSQYLWTVPFLSLSGPKILSRATQSLTEPTLTSIILNNVVFLSVKVMMKEVTGHVKRFIIWEEHFWVISVTVYTPKRWEKVLGNLNLCL